MRNNAIAIWGAVISANIWAASGNDIEGYAPFWWLFAIAVFIGDCIVARKAARMANSPK